MKILHVTPAYEPAWHLGGVVRSVSQLCRGLARLGQEVTVFTTDSGRDRKLSLPLNCPVEVGGVKVYYFRTEFSYKFFYSRTLREACHKSLKNFDIVHLTSFWCYPGIPAAAAARKEGVPYLVSVRGTLRESALKKKAFKKWLYFQAIERKTMRRAAAIHYTTQMEKELDEYHRFRNPQFIVPNGFEVNEFNDLKRCRDARKIWGINPESKIITFLGRLHHVKALDLLIKSISTYELKNKELNLLIAGPDDGAEGSLRLLTNNLGLNKRVRFLGEVNHQERNSLFAASDIFALVSTDENFGNAAVEAMLAGVPVLLSEHVGICREVQADGAGIVVPLEVGAIAGAIEQMLAVPERLLTMGQAAAASARRRYDVNLVARQMATAYEDILTGRRSPGLSWSDR